jgi:hypothetical protein
MSDQTTSRRGLLKGALTTGLAIAGAGLLSKGPSGVALADSVSADGLTVAERVHNIVSIACTAEQLAITMYTNAVTNNGVLGIGDGDINYIKAAAIEEQLHQDLLVSLGAVTLTSTFSFPGGAESFSDLGTFVTTLEAAEDVFISAYIAAVREFAILGLPEFSRIASQIATIEAQHRALGRDIGGLDVANNFGYSPCTIQTVEDGPKALADAGFLSPTTGNSYTYAPVDFTDPVYADVYSRIQFKKPFYSGPPTGRP